MLSIKIRQLDLLPDSKNVFDSIAYLGELYDLLNIRKRSVSTYRLIGSTCKIKCF